MSKISKISWCKSTFNPWIGCTKVSQGCDHCYASVSTPARSLGVKWGAGKPRRRTSEGNWRQPLRWNAEAARTGEFWPVFCASLADVFDNEAPQEWREDLFQLIAATPHLTWLLLTKRIGNVGNMLPVPFDFDRLYPNVWLGATIVNQDEADRDIQKLLAVPAARRFVSYEPALGPVDWTRWLYFQCDNGSVPGPHGVGGVTHFACQGSAIPGCRGLDWIIVGGESDQLGMRARPFDLEWARSTVRQCKAAGVACFVKQLGSLPREEGCEPGLVWVGRNPQSLRKLTDRAGANISEWPADLRVQEFPK